MLLTYIACTLVVLVNVTWAVDQRKFQQLRDDMEQGATADDLFELFKITFAKDYPNATEEVNRRDIFRSSVEVIREHNELFKSNQSSFAMGINQFADMKSDELPSCTREDNLMPSRVKRATPFGGPLPETKDWTKDGFDIAIEDQGQCGSCCTFGVVGSIEGQLFRTTNKIVPLSKQQVVDCEVGCTSTTAKIVFDYIKKDGGLMSKESYPYTGNKGNCTLRKNEIVSGTADVSYMFTTPESEDELKKAIGSVGPVAVGINIDLLHNYASGIFYNRHCSKTMNHRMLAVGYGRDSSGEQYWLLKNSWGTTWGENGYMRLARNGENVCGVASLAVYPILAGQHVPGKSEGAVGGADSGPLEGSSKDSNGGSVGASSNQAPLKTVLTLLCCLSVLSYLVMCN